MDDFRERMDLASERLGGAVVYANDEFFAPKDNLLKPHKAVFIDGKYTDRGKWMDGWETRRRRTPGHDFCIVRLGLPGVVHGVVVDTAFFRGNFPESCSIEGCSVSGTPSPDDLLSASTRWSEILPRVKLEGDKENLFPIHVPFRCTHLRLHIYPDGGVARLRVHGDALPESRWRGKPGAEVDLAAAENGAIVVFSNDMFFGSRHNLIMPGRAHSMADGWETKRSRREGPDFCVVRLASEGQLTHVEVDTSYFKGNAPESASMEVGTSVDGPWLEVIPRTKLQPHTRHHFDVSVAHPPANFARLRIWPDGGVSRLRLWGQVTDAGREQFALRYLNALSPDDAAATLFACCGSTTWSKQMATQAPFVSVEQLQDKAERTWSQLAEEDWLEAFRAHPRIGERKVAGTGASSAWSRQEQAKVGEADAAVLEALAAVNRRYEEKFGHVFLICATGKSAEEMLRAAEVRVENDAATEIKNAAEEQRKIMLLRLERLIRS